MATKAAKSITINATKYELANALSADNGKIQLKAKDVVLDEVTPPASPSAIKLMTVGIDYGSYNKTDILSYSDVFTGTGTDVEINEEKIATGTVPVIYLVEDSTDDPTTSRGYPVTLYPISFEVELSGDISLNYLGVDLYDALSKAVTEYKAHPNAYNRISIGAKYLAVQYGEAGALWGAKNIVSVSIVFNVANGTVVYTGASASRFPETKYVVFDFGYEGSGFVSCKNQDGTDVLTAAAVKDIVLAGGDIYVMSSERINGILKYHRWKATTFDHWTTADQVRFEALFPHSVNLWHKVAAFGTFADNTPTMTSVS